METVEQVARWVAEYETPLTLGGLAVLLLLALVALWVAKRRMGGLKLYGQILAAGTIGFSAEGMWEVARQDLDLATGLAVAVFFVGDGTLVYLAKKAEAAKAAGDPWRRYARGVWTIAGTMGVIVAFSSDSPVEVPLRMALPLLAAYVWWLDVADVQGGPEEPAGRWRLRWTPRRALIEAGVIVPDGQDVEQVDRTYRVWALSRVMTRLDHLEARQARWLAGWWLGIRTARAMRRLQRLTVDATDDMIAEAAGNAQRARVVRARTRSLAAADLDRVAAAEAAAAAARAAADKAVAEAERQQAAAAAATAALERQRAATAGLTAELERQRAAVAEVGAATPAAVERAVAEVRRQHRQQLAEAVAAAEAKMREQVKTTHETWREQVEQYRAEIRELREQLAEATAPTSGAGAPRQRRPAADVCRDVLAYFARYGEDADEVQAMAALGLRERRLREYRNNPTAYLSAEEVAAIRAGHGGIVVDVQPPATAGAMN